MPEPIPDACDEDDADNGICAVKIFLEVVEVGGELDTDIGEEVAPGDGADEREEQEFAKGHFGDACGKGDEGSHDWEET